MYTHLPFDMEELKARIKREMKEMSDSLVRKAVFSMEKRAATDVTVIGRGFEGKAIRL